MALMPRLGRIEFGGPDLTPRRLRNLLQAQVDASPPASRIDWGTYYFRDRALAEALMRASDRGVRVRLVLEPDPRRDGANDATIAMLRTHGLNGGFHLYAPSRSNRGYLHAKIYAFSEPDIAWIGSFNPSGDAPDDADIIADIGDQDRGHNLLLGIERPKLTAALRRHVERLVGGNLLPLRLWPHFNLPVKDDGTRLYYYPRILPCPAQRAVARLRPGDSLRGAISHLKTGQLSMNLKRAAARGVSVELLVHDTERRVRSAVVEELSTAGARIARIRHPDGLPMHAKFLLVDRAGERTAWLGSYNFNKMSRWHNSEVLLRTRDPTVFASLERRYGEIAVSGASD